MKTTIASLKRVALAVLCMLPAAHSFADPYYDWMNDYTGSEPNTLILWKFNVTGETNSHMRDSSGNNRNLHSNTKATFNRPGKFDEGIFIDPDNGTTGMGISSNTSAFNGDAISVEMWFKPLTEISTNGYLFDHHQRRPLFAYQPRRTVADGYR